MRELGGLLRTAGDIAVMEKAKFIKEQIKEKYGSLYKGLARDVTTAQKEGYSPYNYWDQHIHDDQRGYE